MRGLTFISLFLSASALAHALPQMPGSNLPLPIPKPYNYVKPSGVPTPSVAAPFNSSTSTCTDETVPWQSYPAVPPAGPTTTSVTVNPVSPPLPTGYTRPSGASSGFVHSTKTSTTLASNWSPTPTPTPSVVPFTASDANAIVCGRSSLLALVGASLGLMIVL